MLFDISKIGVLWRDLDEPDLCVLDFDYDETAFAKIYGKQSFSCIGNLVYGTAEMLKFLIQQIHVNHPMFAI